MLRGLGLLLSLCLVGLTLWIGLARQSGAYISLIAYQSYQPAREVWVMRSDGSQQWRVGAEVAQKPVWSPKGVELAFNCADSLCLTRWDGSHVRRLTAPSLTVGLDDIAWSPDGTTLLFSMSFGTHRDLYLIGVEGEGLRPLTQGDAINNFASWSPDGTRILLVSNRTGNDDIFVLNLATSHFTNLTQHPAQDNTPKWSPDGSRIIFTSDRRGFDELHLIAPDGSRLQRLARSTYSDLLPFWSPDGSQMLFFSTYSHRTGIQVMRVNDPQPVRYPINYNTASQVSWSPDGEQVAVAVGRLTQRGVPQWDIYALQVAEGSLTRLNHDTAYDFNPAWSPPIGAAWRWWLNGLGGLVLVIGWYGSRKVAHSRGIIFAHHKGIMRGLTHADG